MTTQAFARKPSACEPSACEPSACEPSARKYGMDHSAMAMQAAKRMSRSRQKQKTGRVICHHLRMMLVTDGPVAPVLIRPHAGPLQEDGHQQITLGF